MNYFEKAIPLVLPRVKKLPDIKKYLSYYLSCGAEWHIY